MAIRNIVKEGESILREKAKEVTAFDDKLAILLDDMKDTMFHARGVGLAAPQVGVLRRVCVVCTDGENVYELVNPKIVSQKGSEKDLEGCLSIPHHQGIVERPKKVMVEAYDRNGNKYEYKAEGFTARAFCHEIDHLDGILYIDRETREGK